MDKQADKILDQLYRVALSKVNRLEVKRDRLKGYIKYGKKNDWPEYLLGLAENQAEHGAILKTKSEYLTGQGIDSDDARVKEWIKKANPKEDWNKVKKKAEIDKPIFGAYALKIVPNMFGRPLEHYQIDYGKLRISNCLEYAIYCDDWSAPEREREECWYPIWFPGCREVSIDINKDYFPTVKKIKSVYGHPEYNAIVTDLDTEVRVSTYFNILVQNNFNPGALLTIFKPDPTKEEKEYVSQNVKREHSGEEEVGNILIAYTDPETGKAAEITQFNATDLDKQYQEVGKRNQAKIIIAHKINPVLAGLQQDGKLGLTQELRQSHELFINNYAKPNQVAFIETLEKFSTIELGFDTKGLFKVKQLDLIDLELDVTNTAIQSLLTKDELRKYTSDKYKLDLQDLSAKVSSSQINDSLNALSPLVATKVLETMTPDEIRALVGLIKPTTLDANGLPVQESSVSVNDNMKGLSAAENADVLRIVRDFQRGRSGMTEAMAISRISSYGVTADEARKWLGITPVQMSDERSKIFLSLLNKYAVDIVEDDEILETEYVNESTVKLSEVKFANGQKLTKNQLRNGILEQLKKNPKATTEQLAEAFGIEIKEIEQATTWLLEKELLKPNGKGFDFTDRSFNRDKGTVTEVYTEYNYGLREGVPGPVILDTTRQDCKDWYNLYSVNKKSIPFDAVAKLTNEFGENAFDYSGGFWHNPKTGVTEPRCRHGWTAVTKTRNVKR